MAKKYGIFTKALIAVAVFSFSTGCSKKKDNDKVQQTKKTTETPKRNKAIDYIEIVKNKGRKLPNFRYRLVDGGYITLNDLKGKIVLINIFATYCPPCIRELPLFSEIKEKYKDKNFEILAISSDYYYSDPKKLSEYLIDFFNRHGIKRNFLVAFGRERITRDFGPIRGIPTSFFVDKNGKIIVFRNKFTMEEGYMFSGAFNRDMLDLIVSKLLKEEG